MKRRKAAQAKQAANPSAAVAIVPAEGGAEGQPAETKQACCTALLHCAESVVQQSAQTSAKDAGLASLREIDRKRRQRLAQNQCALTPSRLNSLRVRSGLHVLR